MGIRALERRKVRLLITCVIVGVIVPVVYVSYFCPEKGCILRPGSHTSDLSKTGDDGSELQFSQHHQQAEETNVPGSTSELIRNVDGGRQAASPDRHPLQFSPQDLVRDYNFDIEGQDVLVFLHMQKTGGTTFGRHLVRDMVLDRPCKCRRNRKRCQCENSKRSIWLFSRFSVGWPCGLHADWTELQSCVASELDKREGTQKTRRYRYLYITILRDPVHRYLSEWRHVHRGATWMAAELRCNGRSATLQEVPFCFSDESWAGVSLKEFMECEHNLAKNRQARMLANLSLVGCYNRSAMSLEQREEILLKSAKQNLQDMAFFGLTEFQKETQYLFERTFKLKFESDFVQYNSTHASTVDVYPDLLEVVKKVNRLDLELYQFAKNLFLQRLEKMRTLDKQQLHEGGGGTADAPTNKDNAGRRANSGKQLSRLEGSRNDRGDYREEYDEYELQDSDNTPDLNHRKKQRRKKQLSVQYSDS